MTVLPKKSEQKRLDSSAQTAVHQPQTPINPTFENRSSAQVVPQVPEPPYCLPQRVDQSAEQQQYAEEGILLGECRFNQMTFRQKSVGSPEPRTLGETLRGNTAG